MRRRLRPAHPYAELVGAYPTDHTLWADHVIRVAVSVTVARSVPAASAADLSCGDGTILSALDLPTRHFGDLAPGWPITGPIEQSIHTLPEVDLFICTETVEHLDDPDVVLRAIRGRTRRLLLSTPVDAWDDPNPWHYWAWSRQDVEDMLTAAGFNVEFYVALDLRPANPDSYCFGIWRCV